MKFTIYICFKKISDGIKILLREFLMEMLKILSTF
jgi:hypothetical protein